MVLRSEKKLRSSLSSFGGAERWEGKGFQAAEISKLQQKEECMSSIRHSNTYVQL